MAEYNNALEKKYFENGDFDPWIRENTDPYMPGRRSAFVGNGLIGLRVPLEGEPSVYPGFAEVKAAPGGTQMYGIWDKNKLIPAFNFMGLKIMHGRMLFRRDSGQIINYSQKLDWRTASVTTSCDWLHWGGTLHIEAKIYLSRAQQNVGCLEMNLSADYDTTFVLKDIISAGFIEELQKVDFNNYVMFARLGSANTLLAATSAVTVDQIRIPGDIVYSGKEFERNIILPLQKGEVKKIVKFGALVSSLTSDDPVNTASTLVSAYCGREQEAWKLHVQAWNKIWENRIETDHRGIQMLANNALYHLYCNLNENGGGEVPGPCGLSGNAWGGRIFWDADTWTVPSVALLNPKMASNYAEYRLKTLTGAKRNAAAQGLPGALFAWESAEYGDEIASDLIYSHEIHINSDVVKGIWNYYLTSGDDCFLRRGGAELIFEVARFWTARSIYNPEKDRYEIHNVCCPDEFSGLRNNNAFTNYGAAYTLRLATRLAVSLGKAPDPNWNIIAEKMWIPFDSEKNIVLEYEDYDGDTIKQADTVLLCYPLEYPLSPEVKKATCDYYWNKYPDQKIMMSSAIHGIIAAELGDTDNSWQMMLDLLPHFRSDFLLVSESPFNETMSLLTGLGGLLQLIIMGWGGVRIHNDGLSVQPTLPPQLTYLNILGLHFGGKRYKLEITHESYSLEEENN